MIGEIGRNDYNRAFGLGNKTFAEAEEMVPEVVKVVESAVRVSCLCNQILFPNSMFWFR